MTYSNQVLINKLKSLNDAVAVIEMRIQSIQTVGYSNPTDFNLATIMTALKEVEKNINWAIDDLIQQREVVNE